MIISPLRRSLLALSVAAAAVPAQAAPNFTYDLGEGSFYGRNEVVNDMLLTGKLDNGSVSLTNWTTEGDLVNQGSINRQAPGPHSHHTVFSLSWNSYIAGDLINKGDITATGGFSKGLDLFLPTIAGDFINEGNIIATSEVATGMEVTSTLSRINNSGVISARGEGSKAIDIWYSSFTGDTTAPGSLSNLNNSGTISADGVGIYLYRLNNSSDTFTITQTSGLIEGGTAAIQAAKGASPTYFYWKGGQVKGDLLDLREVSVQGDVLFDGSTIRSRDLNIDDSRLTLARSQTTVAGNLNLNGDSARLRLLLDDDVLPSNSMVKVTGTTSFSPGSQIQLQARSEDFSTPLQGTRYSLLNSRFWNDPQNVSVVSSSALLQIQDFGIDGRDLHARVSTRSDEMIASELLRAGASGNAVSAIAPLKNTVMASVNERDPVFEHFANAATSEELASLAEGLTPDVSRGVLRAATNSQTLVASAIELRASQARNGLRGLDSEQDQGVWLQALSSDAEQDSRQAVAGYDANASGIVVGADGKLTADTTLGVAYSYLTSNVKSDLGHKTDVSGHAVTLYGNWSHDDYFVDTSLMYGWNDNESKRNTAGTRPKAHYDSEMFGANALAGYRFQLDSHWLLEPRLAARYANVAIDAYREKNSAAALKVGSQRYEVGQLGLGTRLAAAFGIGAGTLEPQASLMAWHDVIGDKVGTTSTFVLGGTSFTSKGAAPARDSYELELGADYRVGAWSLGGNYSYLTSSGFTADTFTGKVSYAF